jgi:hypothetical protein
VETPWIADSSEEEDGWEAHVENGVITQEAPGLGDAHAGTPLDRFGVMATIVIDTNDISCRVLIMAIVGPMQNSELRIVEHTGLAHGYMLATVHRANMEALSTELTWKHI